MEQLTAEGLRAVNELAQRYGFSQEAVIHMMFSMLRGRGRMAQFNHPEFAGSGQWMGGGMLMVGDMFNHALKARVDGLCQAIAGLLASQPELFPAGSFQSQSQSGGGQQMQTGPGNQQMQVGGGQQMQTGPGGMSPMMPMSPMAPMGSGGGGLFVADPRDTWWPQELGTPSATGSQNDVRYALFPAAGRLAVEVNGQVSVYDTGGRQIAGFSQQQGPGGAVVFTTPSGTVSLSTLSAVAGGGQQQQQSSGGGQQQQQVGPERAAMTGMTPMTGMGPMGGMAPMAPMEFGSAAGSAWWPPELGSPSATGAQNDLRYAVFPEARRLAVEVKGRLSLHDTGEHRITGCSQQDAGSGVTFTTPTGTVRLDELPPLATAADDAAGAASPPASSPSAGENDVLAALERLGELKQRGILSEEEFAAKKAELLSRL